MLTKFPTTIDGKFNRKFRAECYSLYTKWLEYSFSKDAVFCRFCRIFFSQFTNADPKFARIGFKNWKKATEKFVGHAESVSHKNAEIIYMNRLQQDKNNSSIASLSIYYSEEQRRNREHLKNVISCVIYLAKQGLALRGHDETTGSLNQGNFIELLKFKSNDLPTLKYRLDSNHAIKYICKTSQNEIISILGGQIHKLIIEEIGSGPYSIIIDQTTDLSRDEQVAFCIRYVYKGQIKEKFVKFNTTASTRSDDLEQIVLRHLRELGLSGNFIVGQSYDGASNMSGIYTGLAARLREKFKTAIYIHCYDHRLNLSIKDACTQISEIRNALGTLNSMHSFIEVSAKRHDIFKGIATLENCYIALKHPSETRWASKRSV